MRLLRFVLLLFLLVTVTTPAAWAHARLVRSEPKSGAELSPAPTQIDLWFNELLEDGFNTVTVFPAADLIAEKKTNFVKGKPIVDAKDHTHLTIKLQSIPPRRIHHRMARPLPRRPQRPRPRQVHRPQILVLR